MVNQNKLILKKYIEEIYKFLGEKYCFVSGAFVIEDTDKKLFKLLNSSIDVQLSKTFSEIFKKMSPLSLPIPAKLKKVLKPLTETHANYLPPEVKMFETHMLGEYKIMLNCKCEEKLTTEEKLTPEEEVTAEEEEEFIDDIIAETGEINYVLEDVEEDITTSGGGGQENITRPVRNIKWYSFTEKDINDKDINFIYFKLEDYPTFTKGHFMDAFKRYGKGKAGVCVKSRREDCELDKDGCRFDEKTYENVFESPNSVIIEGKKHDIIETYIRKGDEFFIPAVLNDYLLENINLKNINIENIFRFNHVDNVVEISIGTRHLTVRSRKHTQKKQSLYETTLGGHRSRRTHKKKRTHKKRTHKKRKHTKYRFRKLK